MLNKCLSCGSHSFTVYSEIDNHFLFKCRECDLVQTEIKKYETRKIINTIKYDRKYLLNYINREGELKKRFSKRLIEIEKIKRGGRMLDVGCSTGMFLEEVDKNSVYKWNLYGVDLNTKSISIAKKRLDASFHLGLLKSAKFPSNYFDCITFFDVMEHDDHIIDTLKESFRILKKKGIIVIQSPNYRSIMALLSGAFWDWWCIPDHVIHFDPSTLSSILRNNGFIIQKIFTWEPRNDFVANISGSFRKRIINYLNINKIISKISYYPLNLTWFLLSLSEKKVNLGGLIVVIAQKI